MLKSFDLIQSLFVSENFFFSRMKFLTRKWQKAIRRLSLTGTVNGHAQGQYSQQNLR